MASSPKASDDPTAAPAAALGRARALAALVILALGALGAWAFMGLEVRSSITDFVPAAEGEEDLEALTRELADSETTRTIALTIGPGQPDDVARAAGMLGSRLRARDDVAWVRDGAPEGLERAMHDVYFPRRFLFAAERAADVPALVTDEALRERARALRRELSGPTAMLVRRVAPADPLLLFATHLRALEADGRGGPRLHDGHLVVDDEAGTWGAVFLGTRGTTFSADAQEPVLAAIEAAFVAVRDELALPELRLEQASVHRFAARAERRLRADTSFISTVSSLGIVVLFLLLFRGPRYLLLGAISLGAGMVVATAVCRLVFGHIHGITLAFGSSLLGVAIDFVAHLVNHHVLEPGEGGGPGTARRLAPGLVLGAVTTVLGLGGLALTSFPGMQELALFSAVGVLSALIATLALVPPFLPARPTATRLHRWLAERLEALWSRARNARGGALAVLGLALALCIAGAARMDFVDDLRALSETDPALAAEDRAVRARVAQGDAGRLAVALGENDESALTHAEAMTRALELGVEHGELRRFRAPTRFLRSAATQRAVREALDEDGTLAARTAAALEAEGFVPAMFAPFGEALAEDVPPVTFTDLEDTPIAELVRPMRISLAGGRVAYLALLDGVTDDDALRARLEAEDGVLLFDQARFLAAAYRTFRMRTAGLVLGGLIVVLGLCVLRYRSLRLGLAAVVPAVIASIASVAVVALVGSEVNMMHLVACLLVLSMGEDYAVFLLESRDLERGPSTTMVGLLVAGATTVLSFGLLAVSSHPALRALGVVSSLGVLFSMLLAPLALLVAAPVSRARP